MKLARPRWLGREFSDGSVRRAKAGTKLARTPVLRGKARLPSPPRAIPRRGLARCQRSQHRRRGEVRQFAGDRHTRVGNPPARLWRKPGCKTRHPVGQRQMRAIATLLQQAPALAPFQTLSLGISVAKKEVFRSRPIALNSRRCLDRTAVNPGSDHLRPEGTGLRRKAVGGWRAEGGKMRNVRAIPSVCWLVVSRSATA